MPQNEHMTLRQGLDDYYATHPDFKDNGDFLGQPRETVTGHDAVHVLFNLGATSEEELIVEVMTFFGCILPVKKIVEMPKVKFAQELWKIYGPWRLVRRFVLTIPRMIRAFVAAMRMTKRWPHFAYEQYMNVPLNEIREEFGIRLPV